MKSELITFIDPKSPVSEMFKTLRTNIQFMNADKQLKTLLVSSTLPGEGKSWTSANLAVTFAQAGKKVLLVDADMRKGRQFNIFDVSPVPGLSNYLSGMIDGETGDYEIKKFIQNTEIENLDIMVAGNVPPNPSELLVSEKMINLAKKVREMYDITIFDGTPSLVVTDAPILSRLVDSTIIVTAHNDTKIDNVVKVRKAIENVGGTVAGVVLNKIPNSVSTYGYYYGGTSLETVDENRDIEEEGFVDKIKNKFLKREQESEYIYTKNLSNTLEKLIAKSESEEENKDEQLTCKEQKQETPTFEQPVIEPKVEETVYEKQKEIEQPVVEQEEEKEAVQEEIKKEADKTQDILDQVRKYLEEEKNKLNNGDK
jgi:capsular exopolysaccharide synthesis family protein